MNIASQALGAGHSPFPVSFDGSGLLFGAALFVLLTIFSVALMIGRGFAQRLWADRKSGKDLLWAFRMTILAFCAAAVTRAGPEVLYMIAYAEAGRDTLQVLLTIKRVFDVLTIVPAMTWMILIYIYSPEIEFLIKYPLGKMWTDFRLYRLRTFALVFGSAAGLALCVTVGRLLT